MTIKSSQVLGDNAYGTLASGLTVSDTTLPFTTGHGARFPAVASGQILNCCILNSNNVLEEIHITLHVAGSDTATFTRAANGTTAKAWNAGDRVEARVSSEVLNLYASDFAAIASGRNIAARTDASTPNTKLNISADELVVADTSGNRYNVGAISLNIDFTTTGANALDTGSQILSTWYYGWVIYNPNTNTVAALGSVSATAPTMPSGYTFKALVTAARSDASVHFIKYRQFGNRVKFETAQNVMSGGAATIETAVTVATAVPPPAIEFTLFLRSSAIDGGNLRFVTGSNYHALSTVPAGSSGAQYAVDYPNISQQFFYLLAGASGGSLTVDVLGFKLPLGGE